MDSVHWWPPGKRELKAEKVLSISCAKKTSQIYTFHKGIISKNYK